VKAVAAIACAVVIAIVVLPALWRLPAVGDYRGPYGDAVVPVSLAERHTSNVVATVAYDVRGFDTFGEELMLLAAVVGVALLLRPVGEQHRETRGVDRARPVARGENTCKPEAQRTSANVLAIAIVFGWYMALHATQTPGGGFQGGAIVASALALIYLGGGYAAWVRGIHEPAFDVGEAAGVLGFAAIIAVPLGWGGPLVSNWLPLGSTGQFASGGAMFAMNIAIGVAVAAGFAAIVGSLVYDLHESIDELDQDDREVPA
jgi:multicomponent Na+:H+ antiporter subunit B